LNPGCEVKLGGSLYVVHDPCAVGAKPIGDTPAFIHKEVGDISWQKEENNIQVDYVLEEEVGVSLEILTPDKQLLKRDLLGQKTVGQQQLSLKRSDLPTGEFWVCLKKGRERHYFLMEN